MDRVTPPAFLQGVIAPLLTAIHADRSLDLKGEASLVEWLASRRCVRSLFIRSGGGRMFTFTVRETKEFTRAVIDASAGRFGILMNASGQWLTRDVDRTHKPDSSRYTADAVELTRFAERIGADAAVHVMPEAITPRGGESLNDAVFRYFQTVHDASDIPIVIYNPPALLPDYNITPEMLKRLLNLPRIAGLKLSTADEVLFGTVADATRGHAGFALICGNEELYFRGLEQGAVGVIGEGCNVYPEILHAVRANFRAGRLVEAMRMQRDVLHALGAKYALEGDAARHRSGVQHGGYVHGQIAWMQVLIRHGVRIQPFDRNPQAPYPDERIAKLDDAVRALVAVSRRSLPTGTHARPIS